MAIEYSKDGRRKLPEPCAFGHRYQAMECPSCSELLGHGPQSEEHWEWYRKRSGKRQVMRPKPASNQA
jgi:hypothetical protein